MSQFETNVTPKEKLQVSAFAKDLMTFEIKAPPKLVWKKYLSLDLNQVLNSRYSKVCAIKKAVKGKGNLHLGLKAFVNMLLRANTIISPVMRSMTALEITKLDDKNKFIEMTYLEGTPSKGWQTIKLIPFNKGTKVVHESYYQGLNELVHEMYPVIHKKIWNAIHKAAKAEIEKENSGR